MTNILMNYEITIKTARVDEGYRTAQVVPEDLNSVPRNEQLALESLLIGIRNVHQNFMRQSPSSQQIQTTIIYEGKNGE